MTIILRLILSTIIAALCTFLFQKIHGQAAAFNFTLFIIVAIGTAISALASPLIKQVSLPKIGRQNRESGTVKWFNVSKGYGFVTRTNGEDIFVHFRSIKGKGRRALVEGQQVEFIVTEGEKGPQAEEVEILGDN